MINRERLIKLTRKLISFDSCNPPGSELACARFIEKDMRSLGLEVKTFAYAPNRPNIVATLKGSMPRAKAEKEAVLLTPHFDTVPFGRGWTVDPLGGEIRGGKIFGRGASDDKGNCACCMEVMRSLVEDGARPRKDVVMAATVDEETGSHHGVIPLIHKGVLRPGLAVVLDSTGFDAVVAQKGLIHGRIQVFGKKAHGAYNWRGHSAIDDAARIITRLRALKYPFKKHPLLRAPSMNIGVIHGGDKVNMVCDFVEFSIDHRYLPGTDWREVIKRIRAVCRKEAGKFRIIIDARQSPFEIPRGHPYVKAYLEVCRQAGQRAAVKGSEGATVITFFQEKGVPAFATGFGAHGTAHTNDEYVYIKSLADGVRVLEDYLKVYDQL
jgi:acetylornithine deacetylase/succinyl-diaminopimelate desuccinylase family protein